MALGKTVEFFLPRPRLQDAIADRLAVFIDPNDGNLIERPISCVAAILAAPAALSLPGHSNETALRHSQRQQSIFSTSHFVSIRRPND